MPSLDSSIRSCNHQVTRKLIPLVATSFITFVLIFAAENKPLHKGATVGLVATLGSLTGLYYLGRLYVYFKGRPEPLPDEERPSPTESQMHPTMRPMSGHEEKLHDEERPGEQRQGGDETAHKAQESLEYPPSDDARPQPLNIPSRPQGNPSRPYHPGPGYSRPPGPKNSPPDTISGPGPGCPAFLRPGLTNYRPPWVSAEQETEHHAHAIDSNGSPIMEGSRMRGSRFVGNGPGHLPRSAPGLHQGPLHVVNLATVPAQRDFRQFCKKYDLPYERPGFSKLLGTKARISSPTPRPNYRHVKKHRVKAHSPVPVSPSICVVIDDSTASEHGTSSATDTDNSSPSTSPSSTDTTFSIDVPKK